MPSEVLEPLVEEWTAAGLVQPDEAERILRYERERAGTERPEGEPGRRHGRLAEVLGSLGAVGATGAAVVGAVGSWAELETWARVVLPALGTVLLIGAGALVPQDRAPLVRFRGLLWFLAVCGAAATSAVVAADALDLSAASVVLVAGLGTSVVAVPVLALHRGVLGAVGVAGGSVLVVLGLIAQADHADSVSYGLALWGLGAVTGLLGWALADRLRTTWLSVAVLELSVGALVLAGPEAWWGIALGALTSLVVIGLSTPLGSRAVLGLGLASLFTFVVRGLVEVSAGRRVAEGGRIGPVLAVFGLGVVLLAVAVLASRRHRENGGEGGADHEP